MIQRAERPQQFLPLWLLQSVAIYWLLLKLAALFIGEPHADEAYYWLWGQHLALSYFDHPGLHAWLQGGIAAVFGWSVFSLRLLSLVTTAVTLVILYLWARRLAPAQWQQYFWLSAALFYSTPLMLLYTTIGTLDRLLAMCVLVSMHFFGWFLADWAEGKRSRYAALYLGAIFLGFAALTKYSGALLGVGVGVAILVRPDLRSLLRSPHLYVAAALSIAMQAPTLYWNLTQDLASFSFHLEGGFAGVDALNEGLQRLLRVTLETVVLVSPFAVVPMIGFLVRRAGEGRIGILHSVGKWTFIVSTLMVVALVFVRDVLFYWNIVAYAAFFGLAGWFLRSRVLQIFQFAYGILLGTALLVQFSVVPFLAMLGVSQPDAKGMYGWREIAKRVEVVMQEQDAEFPAAGLWELASRLGFALQRPDVMAITAKTDGFDFWTDVADYVGKDAIVVVEDGDDPYLSYVAGHFDSFEQVDAVAISSFGRPVASYRIYLGRNYQVAAPAP
jgi:4-amino-4-deoxy-L-arabinose transferase-like glycosyltransferase